MVGRSLKRREVRPNPVEINEAVDRPQQMLFRHVPFCQNS
jgi:hypothetical protein